MANMDMLIFQLFLMSMYVPDVWNLSKRMFEPIYKPYGLKMCKERFEKSTDYFLYIEKEMSCLRFPANAINENIFICPGKKFSKKAKKIVPTSLAVLPRWNVCYKTYRSIPDGYILAVKGSDIYTKYHQEKRSWSDALRMCQSEGGTLLNVHTKARKSLFKKLHSMAETSYKRNPWIGLSRQSASDAWTWSDGTPGGKLKWSSFGGLYTPSWTCAVGIHIFSRARVLDLNCSSRYRFICEALPNG